jgi:hypothetical protein
MIEKLNPEHENTAGHMAATTAAFQVRFLLRAVPSERHPDRARYATGRYRITEVVSHAEAADP